MKIRCIVLAFLCLGVVHGQPVDLTYDPITAKGRATWFVNSTVGPRSLAAGVLSASWGTAWNLPEEYNRTWEGFGKRFGMRLTGVSTGNAIEATLGAAWGEDPRYFRSTEPGVWNRVKHSIKYSFYTKRPGGSLKFAYARLAGNVGNNFLANTWRVESESSAGDAGLRVLWGVLGKMGGNTFDEFWPDIQSRIFRRK